MINKTLTHRLYWSTYLFIFLFVYVSTAYGQEQIYVPDPDPLVQQRLEDWQDLKFGLLMHWGAYSQWGIVESWSLCPEDYGWCARQAGRHPDHYFEYKKEYESLIHTFNPVKFNPSKWAEAAKKAGMKYVVFTTKHHDGFCMFDSQYTDYKITSTDCPFHTNPKANVAREIFDAFRSKGLWTGAYFSKPDWHSPYYWDPYFPPLDRNVNYDPAQYPDKWAKFVEFTHNQILELMTEYGQMDILWLDGGWVAKKAKEDIEHWMGEKVAASQSGFLKNTIINQDIQMDELVEKVRQKQPGIIVVDRAVEGKNQNYLTPENRVPEKELPFPWESCIIAGGGWSWVHDAKYKTSNELIRTLVDIVCKGGNLLLNIAPGPDGTWDEAAYERLDDIGTWIKINGEAIYGTRAIAPYKEGNVCYTRKRKTGQAYAIYLPDDGQSSMPPQIILKSLTPAAGSTVTLLGTSQTLQWTQSPVGTVIQIPTNLQKNPPCEYAWVIMIDKIQR